jgi:uncharacterized protein YukE
VIPTPPATYAGSGSNAVISVDAELLVNFSKQVNAALGIIGDDLTTIFGTLNNLQLGWAGQSATEAQDFFDRLDACLTALYGKSGDTTSADNSMLGRVSNALNIAGNNYLATEDWIISKFDAVSKALSSGSTTNPPSFTPVTDSTKSAISET